MPEPSIRKGNWNLANAKSRFISLVDGFNLKGVSLQVDPIKVKSRQDLTPVTLVARCAVTHWQRQYIACKDITAATDDAPDQFPIRGGAAGHIARTDDHVVAFDRLQEVGKVAGIVRK